MALTEEQLKEIAVCEMRTLGYTGGFDEGFQLIERFLAAMPKPEAVAEVAPSTDGSGIIGVKWSESANVRRLMFGDNLYPEAPIAQPASVPSEQKPECPYPCGWENLHSLIVSNGALIVRSIDPDSVSDSTWTAISNTIEHAKELCKHGMLPSAAPQTDYKAQRDALLEAVDRIVFNSEEYDFEYGMGRGAPQIFWDELDAAIASVKGGA